MAHLKGIQDIFVFHKSLRMLAHLFLMFGCWHTLCEIFLIQGKELKDYCHCAKNA